MEHCRGFCRWEPSPSAGALQFSIGTTVF